MLLKRITASGMKLTKEAKDPHTGDRASRPKDRNQRGGARVRYDASTAQADPQGPCRPRQNPSGGDFLEIEKSIPKFTWNLKGPQEPKQF